MQAIINDALAVLIACVAIGVFALALIVFRPRRRHRHRGRRSHRPKIDLFAAEAAASSPKTDA